MKYGIFFCDIVGTITGGDDREKELKTLVEYLNDICDLYNLDNIYFSFISSNHINDVLKYIKEIEPFFADTKVKVGVQFSNKHEIYPTGEIKEVNDVKASQMVGVLDEFSPSVVFYADDVNLNQKIASRLIQKANGVDIIPFIPNSQEGISSLNSLIGKYIEENSKTKGR